MKIFGAIGLGLGIIILRFLVPDIFHALEKTFLLFFHILQTALTLADGSMSAGTFLPQLPQLPM